MTLYLPELIVSFLVFGSPVAILIWAIQRWRSRTPRIGAPAWRSYVAVGALSVAALSEFLWYTPFVWAYTIGPSYVDDRLLIWLVRVGFSAGPTGLLMSLFGKGSLRWPAWCLSALMTLLWVGLGLAG
jgi:hypothetical protein